MLLLLLLLGRFLDPVTTCRKTRATMQEGRKPLHDSPFEHYPACKNLSSAKSVSSGMKYRRWFVCSKGPYLFRKQALKILYDRDCFYAKKLAKKPCNLGLLSYRGIFTPFYTTSYLPVSIFRRVTYSSHIEGIFTHTAFEEQKKKSLNCKEIFKNIWH